MIHKITVEFDNGETIVVDNESMPTPEAAHEAAPAEVAAEPAAETPAA